MGKILSLMEKTIGKRQSQAKGKLCIFRKPIYKRSHYNRRCNGNAKGNSSENMKKKAGYVFVLIGNQGILYTDVKLFFEDDDILSECDYTKAMEDIRSSIEKHVYW